MEAEAPKAVKNNIALLEFLMTFKRNQKTNLKIFIIFLVLGFTQEKILKIRKFGQTLIFLLRYLSTRL